MELESLPWWNPSCFSHCRPSWVGLLAAAQLEGRPKHVGFERRHLPWEQVRDLITGVSARVAKTGGANSPPANLVVLAALALCLAQATPAFAQPDEAAAEAPPALGLANLDLLDRRDGFAIPANSRFLPGETIHVYFQIDGYQVDRDYRISLNYEMRALDPDGRSFFEAEGGNIEVELAPQDKDWMPVVRYSPRIPDHAGGGTYSIQIVVRDRLAGATGFSATADRGRWQPRAERGPAAGSKLQFLPR